MTFHSYLCSLGLVVEESVDLFYRPVVGADDESVVVHVEDEVLTHNGQADESDVTVSRGHLAHCGGVAHQLSVAGLEIQGRI